MIFLAVVGLKDVGISTTMIFELPNCHRNAVMSEVLKLFAEDVDLCDRWFAETEGKGVGYLC
jgi:hypothetical protein